MPWYWYPAMLESTDDLVYTPPNAVILAADLKRMLTSGQYSDVAIYVGQRTFSAHRNILRARSPYFEGLFSSSMRDAAADGITIVDVEADVFEQLLFWVYAGELAPAALQTKDMLEHLLMAANRYDCRGLKLLCDAKLCESLSVENAATRLVLAEQAEADQLKESCLEFIKSHLAEVTQTEAWVTEVMGAGVSMMNEVIAALAAAPAAGKGKKRTADEAGLSATEQEINEMRGWKTVRLLRELGRRELDTAGRKPELFSRLERAVHEPQAAEEESRGSSGSSSSSGGGGSSSSAIPVA